MGRAAQPPHLPALTSGVSDGQRDQFSASYLRRLQKVEIEVAKLPQDSPEVLKLRSSLARSADSSRKEAVDAHTTHLVRRTLGWMAYSRTFRKPRIRSAYAYAVERARFTTSVEVQRYLPNVGLSRTRVLDFGSATKPERLADFTNDGTPLGWLVEGSIREDDYNTNLAIVGCAKPRNPPSAIDRVQHHFYDPDTNGGLGSAPSPGCPRRSGRSESWGAGRVDRESVLAARRPALSAALPHRGDARGA